jgi:hypothetical protein
MNSALPTFVLWPVDDPANAAIELIRYRHQIEPSHPLPIPRFKETKQAVMLRSNVEPLTGATCSWT